MSLRIIYGKSGTGKTNFCLQEIKKIKNKKIYIITPEQFSYSMEKRLLEILENNVSLNAEVISFKRIANRVFTEVGGANELVISKSSQAMIIYSILQQQKDKLKFLGKTNENIELILKEITELKKHNITKEKIEENIGNISDINLQGKLQDINTIYTIYEEKLKGQYIDEDDILTKLAKEIPQSKMFDDSIIYIDEFAGFTIQEYNILKEILKKAEMVNICICTDNLSVETVPETDIFYSNKIFAKKIVDIAKELNIKKEKPILLKKNYRLQNSELKHLEENLYNVRPEKYLQEVKNIKINLENNEYSEIENIAKKIINLVKKENYRYNDIAIISNNLSDINNIIKVIFSKYEIPFFIDENVEITENILIKYIISIIEIFSNNWSQESVLNYIKSGFTELEKEDIYNVEKYCTKNGIKGNKWYKTRWEELYIQQEKITKPLLNLKNNLEKDKKAKAISERLYKFIEENKIAEKMNKKIEMLEKAKEIETAKIYKSSLEILIEVFDEIVNIFNDEKMSFEKYKELLKVGLKSKEVGQIPQFMDQVIIGNIDRTRTHKIKAMFIIGANDGSFPSVNKNEGYFNDKDRDLLKENNLEIAKNTLENLYEDQFNIYKAFTTAEEKIYISYDSTNKDGASLRPSILINKIKKIFPNIKEQSEVLKENIEVINQEVTFEELIEQIRKLSNDEKIEDYWYDIYNWYNKREEWKEKLKKNLKALEYSNMAEKINEKNIKELYGEKIKTSISKMEQYKKCPFSFHLKYGLKLKETEQYKLKSIDTGSFMHEVLDEFFEIVENINEVTSEEIEKIIKNIIEEKLKLNKNQIFSSSPKFIILTNKLKNTIIQSVKYIVYQIQNSDFKPLAHELEFSKKIENIEVTGKIDRIDIAQDKYIRIIDYKSSEKNLDLNQMIAGTQIQLLTYIDILSKQKDKEPAGVLYFNLIEPIINESKNLTKEEIEEKIRKSFKMKGLILADVQVIKLMDKELIKGSSSNIPVYLDKDGNISNSRSSVVTKEQFNDLQKAIEKIIKKISKEILTGNIEIKPIYDTKIKQSACKFCEFKNICRFDAEENQYEFLGTKSKEQILNEIQEWSE